MPFARRTPDDSSAFYNVQHLTSPHIDDVCRITICTIQRLYSILRGEDLPEDGDEMSGAELAAALAREMSRTNRRYRSRKFDFIVTDECHRSIYNLWRQVLEYFDAFLIGLTATPAPQTIAYFHQNRVAEYNHQRAVVDGVNVREFCLSPSLRIAVTVDMIATGTDIKPLEVLVFLRDVRSRVYFEQMTGRGTRVLTSTDLQSVSGEDARAKTRFVIIDAVGVCESDKTESRPLDRNPSMALKSLLQRVTFPGGRDEDTLTTLASRLARLDRELEPDQRLQIAAASNGQSPATLAGALLRAYDPDAIAERATGRVGAVREYVPADAYDATQKELIIEACAPFDKPALRDTFEALKRETEQTLDIYTPDEVLSQGFDADAKAKATALVDSFRNYLVEHRAEIDALQILYSRPFKQRLSVAGWGRRINSLVTSWRAYSMS